MEFFKILGFMVGLVFLSLLGREAYDIISRPPHKQVAIYEYRVTGLEILPGSDEHTLMARATFDSIPTPVQRDEDGEITQSNYRQFADSATTAYFDKQK